MCETITVIVELPEHTNTNLCDHLEKVTLLFMAGVTPIKENIIEKHYTEEEEEESTWKTMQSHLENPHLAGNAF